MKEKLLIIFLWKILLTNILHKIKFKNKKINNKNV